jgi:adenylate cyclase
MPQEIERKFLVKGEYKHLSSKSYRIAQGYLSTASNRTVRIRIKGDKGYITIKGKRSESGLSRYEWEKEIPVNEAQELLALCKPTIIDKTRYEVIFEEQTFEVDEFYGENEGLTVAELELESEDTTFLKPHWLGEEVTQQKCYNNSFLSRYPFSEWKH